MHITSSTTVDSTDRNMSVPAIDPAIIAAARRMLAKASDQIDSLVDERNITARRARQLVIQLLASKHNLTEDAILDAVDAANETADETTDGLQRVIHARAAEAFVKDPLALVHELNGVLEEIATGARPFPVGRDSVIFSFETLEKGMVTLSFGDVFGLKARTAEEQMAYFAKMTEKSNQPTDGVTIM